MPSRPSARRTPLAASGRAAGVLGVLTGLALVAGAAAPGLITVQRGDTLSQLAREHGTTVAAIKAANGRSSDTIFAGESLRLPGARPAETRSETTEVTYVVRAGDTLTAIARSQGASIKAISARNSLDARGLVKIGQRLAIPRTVRSVAPSTGPTSTSVPTGSVAASAAAHREQLRRMSLPSKAQARALVAETARAYGVPVAMAVAVAYHESGFQQRVVSGVDAIGVMQVLPRTGRNLERDAGRSLDLLDTRDNVTAGVLLLRQLLRSEGNQRDALAGYYQGVGSIARQGLLPQTLSYIRSIEVLQERFANG